MLYWCEQRAQEWRFNMKRINNRQTWESNQRLDKYLAKYVANKSFIYKMLRKKKYNP